jgi:hypothetical protein
MSAPGEPLLRNDAVMRYRPLGRTGLDVSALSFGCMRLDDDAELNKRLLGRALELGVNYFETARGYCGGQCQQRVAAALGGRTKGGVVSGKAGVQAKSTGDEFRREVELQLETLGLDRFRFFQAGWLRWGAFPHVLKRGGALEAIRKAQDDGLIEHVGFTGHDAPENFVRIVETGVFDSITIPYNMLNTSYAPVIARAAELGVAVTVMCPVAGGLLAHNSSTFAEMLETDLTTVEMALRFVLSNRGVSTACSGMKTLDQLEQNTRAAGTFDPAAPGEIDLLSAGLDRVRSRLAGTKFCTDCRRSPASSRASRRPCLRPWRS